MNFPNSWELRRARFSFKLKDIRGANAPLASATKDGVSLRSELDYSVWNPASDIGNYKLVELDDFVIGLRSFQHGISHSTVRGLVSPAYTVLYATEGLIPGFYKHYFRSSLLVSRLANITQGIRQGQTVDTEAFLNLRIPVPPLAEQRRIADFLDAETARIDKIHDRRIRQVATLRERAYAEVSEILIPGILTRPLGDPPWPWLPEMTSERPLTRLGYVCRLQNGVTVDGKRDVTGDVVARPYLRVANVQAGRVDLSTVAEISVPRSVTARSTLRRGDVLMTEGGDLDKLGRGTVWNEEIPDCLHQNHVFALRPDPELLDGRYLSLLTQTVHGRCYFESTGSRTTNLASTNSNKILSFPIPLPSVQRQRNLANEAQKGLDRVSKTIVLLERQLKLLAERRQALITAAVTGQFDVSTASGRGVTE
jgi:type I restriction enzyme S subunit